MNWKKRIGIVAGNALEYYDIAVFAAISGYLSLLFSQHGVPHATEIVWGMFALRFLIRPLGGVLIGWYANHAGRKSALIFTSLLTGSASALLACVPGDLSGRSLMLIFFIVQIAQAFAFGGEYPTLINLLLNDADEKHRASVSGLIVGSSLAGVIFSNLVVWILRSTTSEAWMTSTGWRIPVFLGIANVAVSLWFRLNIPDVQTKIKARSPDKTTVHTMVEIFLLTIPGAVVFYVLNIASNITGNLLFSGLWASLWPMLNSMLLLCCVLISGYITDRKFNPLTAFRFSIMALLISGVPLYLMLGSDTLLMIIISQLCILLVGGILLSNLAAVLWEYSAGKNVSLGFGYNISLSVFGGITPLLIIQLTPYGMAAAGAYVALSALPALVPLRRRL